MNRIVNGAFGLAMNQHGQVLITQRNQPEDSQAHLKWQIPGGGQEFGEHLETTLKRELHEELGIEQFTLLYPHPLFQFSLWDHPGDQPTHVNLFVYLIDIGNQILHIGDPETLNWQWVSPDEVTTLDCLPHVIEFIHQAVTIKAGMKQKLGSN